MALKTATRGAQRPLHAEFIASFNDTMVDVNGATKTFGSVFGDQGTFEIIKLPVGARIVGANLLVETAGVGPTAYTVSLGTSASATNILAATDLKTAALTTVTVTNTIALLCNDGSNVRATIASTVANATAGKFRVVVSYVIDGKVDEVVTN